MLVFGSHTLAPSGIAKTVISTSPLFTYPSKSWIKKCEVLPVFGVIFFNVIGLLSKVIAWASFAIFPAISVTNKVKLFCPVTKFKSKEIVSFTILYVVFFPFNCEVKFIASVVIFNFKRFPLIKTSVERSA